MVQSTKQPELFALLEELRPVLSEYLESLATAPVTTALPPSQLRGQFPNNLVLSGTPNPDLRQLVSQVLEHSARTASPRFLDKLYSGSDAVGQFSELLLALLNTNVHVYSVSPVATLMEHESIAALSDLCGFKTPASGVFQPGGSASNMLAMITARNLIYPEIKRVGAAKAGLQLAVFTSADGHYSIEKAAIVLGLGLEAVIKVPVHGRGKGIDPNLLESSLRESYKRGETPYFVNLTAGTTVFSAFDDIVACSEVVHKIEREYGLRIWIHIDGSYGGPVIFSPTLKKQLMNGIETADSFTINPHKILGVPQQCSVLLVNSGNGFGRDALWTANGLNVEYLFHKEKSDTEVLGNGREGEEDGGYMMNIGNGTIGCGRRPDSIKFYLCWSYHGTSGWGGRVERAFDNVTKLKNILAASKSFEIVIPVEYITPRLTVSFWCIPGCVLKRYGSVQDFLSNKDVDSKTLLKNSTLAVHRELIKRGKYMIDYMGITSQGLTPFIRVCISHPAIDDAFLYELVAELESITSRCRVDWGTLNVVVQEE
ncbi:hypothetical protein HDU79_002532 [Rhizoclosmatium sp. JEL0117]|nr:hypothetical protein HDU79_002532 [Rhizoclosmatium sp. JEL0117]